VTRRVLLSYLTITVIVLLVLEIPLAVFFQQRETERLAVNVERDATTLATLYEDALERRTAPDPQAASDYADSTGARVVIVSPDGVSQVDTSAAIDRDFSTRPEIQAALRGERSTGMRHSDTLGTDLLYVAVPVASGGTVHGAIRLTLDAKEVNATVRRFWLGLAGVAAVVLTAMAGIGWAIARSVTRPLRTLHSTADRFATGDLTPTVPDPDAPPEIAALEATLNAMAHRLDQLLAEQRAFVADASHQLRTPLTALRLRLENLQSGLDTPEDKEDLAAAIEETYRLAGLVEDLLKLARAEQTAAPEPADLVQIARERVDTWSAIADAAGVALDFTAPAATAVVSAVPMGVEQILDNLIDNAVTASPPGASVSVTVTPGQEQHRLTIADAGPGLDDEQKARALDRFWRLDTANPGTGLGLPIARALAEASGGSLLLDDGPAGGLAVTVALPAAIVRA
jgi:signal transduction histidine kinase